MGKSSPKSGNEMICPGFIAVGAADQQFSLADLSVTGYDPYDPKTDDGGTSGEFRLQKLNSSGATEITYRWYDDDSKKGWYDGSGKAIPGGAASVKFDAGQAFWCIGKGYTLQSAGQVSVDKIIWKTPKTGNAAVGNGFPVEVTLDKITISGYDPYDPKTDDGGTSGEFRLQLLTSQGETEVTYRWYDDDSKKGWYDGSGKAIAGGASSVKIAAGRGFWCIGKGYTMEITGPSL